MNNLDPFNLRRHGPPDSPLQSIFQQGASGATKISRQIAEQGKQAIQQGRQAIEDAAQSVVGAGGGGAKAKSSAELESATREDLRPGEPTDGEMAFSVPRNIPNFQDPVRNLEDRAWPHVTAGIDSVTQRVGGAASGVFGNGYSKELPMYKDKPYNYAASGRRAWWRKRRMLVVFALVIVGCVYLFTGMGENSTKRWKEGLWKGSERDQKGQSNVDWLERRDRVRDAFRLSWAAYERYAWGYDEYKPLSKHGKQMVPPNGLGWIIVDSLDTMMLMNLTSELAHARQWISDSLSYDVDHDVSTFETTIRMLGGLLSAHYLSTEFPDMAPVPNFGEQTEDLYLEKAADLADRLLGAYDSPSGIPWASVNLKSLKGIQSHADGGASSTAEATSLQLEMKYLAKLTGETHYWEHAEKVMKVVDDNGARDGLLPIFIYADRGTFRGNNIRLGSRGDSYYEYLIKQYLQTNREEAIYRQMWDQALTGVRKHLLTYSSPSNFLVLAERPGGLDASIDPKMDHLVCFMPGTIALAVTGGDTLSNAKESNQWNPKDEENMEIARELMKTCWGMYRSTPTGLAPEIAHFHIHDPPLMYEDFTLGNQAMAPTSPSVALIQLKDDDAEWKEDYIIRPADTHNLQRPETVESLFYMWRITKDEMYRHWGWEMFQAFVEWTTVKDSAGFSSINDVTKASESGHGWRDNMESFWLVRQALVLFIHYMFSDLLTGLRRKLSSIFTYCSQMTISCPWIRSSSTPKRIRSRASTWAGNSKLAGQEGPGIPTGIF